MYVNYPILWFIVMWNGWCAECDLDFTDKRKNKLIDFPPASDYMKVSFGELSPFARNVHIKSTRVFWHWDTSYQNSKNMSSLYSEYIKMYNLLVYSPLPSLIHNTEILKMGNDFNYKLWKIFILKLCRITTYQGISNIEEFKNTIHFLYIRKWHTTFYAVRLHECKNGHVYK
jgi:hypothetical protein